MVFLAVLVLVLLFGRKTDEQPAAPVVAPGLLITAATSRDVTIALPAYRMLERLGHCPHLGDSPASPIGMLAAAYRAPDSDTEQVGAAMRLLVKQGCDLDQYSASGLTPLHNAVLLRDPVLVRFLLDLGADPLLRVIPIPGRDLGRGFAHLDAYGMAQMLQQAGPDDEAMRNILDVLRPAR